MSPKNSHSLLEWQRERRGFGLGHRMKTMFHEHQKQWKPVNTSIFCVPEMSVMLVISPKAEQKEFSKIWIIYFKNIVINYTKLCFYKYKATQIVNKRQRQFPSYYHKLYKIVLCWIIIECKVPQNANKRQKKLSFYYQKIWKIVLFIIIISCKVTQNVNKRRRKFLSYHHKLYKIVLFINII